MLKFGIIGNPLKHTLSPIMHTAALQYLNIDGEYKTYEVVENELEQTLKHFKSIGIRGFSVTIPHKKNIIPLLDELTERAKLIGAVNTVLIKPNGKMLGDNTDVIGFWEAIPEEIRKNISSKTVTILGGGGSANACIVACISNGIKKINVLGRNMDKLKQMVETLRCNASTTINANLLENIDLSNTTMLVNTTPVGMFPNTNASPLKKEDLKKLPKDAVVYDIIYNPPETQLLKDAKSLNLKTINGVEMLIKQGAASLAMWLEQDIAPEGAMRLAVVDALRATHLQS